MTNPGKNNSRQETMCWTVIAHQGWAGRDGLKANIAFDFIGCQKSSRCWVYPP